MPASMSFCTNWTVFSNVHVVVAGAVHQQQAALADWRPS